MNTNITQAVTTNLNQVIIEILSGVKDASGEIYGASKTAVVQSVDFVKDQAPEVVSQFIMWQMIEAIGMAVTLLATIIVLVTIANKLFKAAQKLRAEDSYLTENVVGLRLLMAGLSVAAFICFVVMFSSIKTAVQITIAPKYYVVQYIVNEIKDKPNK